MGMEFPEPPDMEMAADEKRKEQEAKNKQITEDDCWMYLYIMQKYEPTETDDGYRMIYHNTMSGKFRMKKKVGSYQRVPLRNSRILYDWDWDGDAYEL